MPPPDSPPQATSSKSHKMAGHPKATSPFRCLVRSSIAENQIPASGMVSRATNETPKPGGSDAAVGLGFSPEFKAARTPFATYGPVVAIVSVTGVVPAPTAIERGLKVQLDSLGRFAQAKLTVEVNVALPRGAAEKL